MTHIYMLFDQSSVTEQEKLWNNSMISEGSALRYAIIMLRLFRERIDHENEEGVIVDMLITLEFMSFLLGTTFIQIGMTEIGPILHNIFTYNVWPLCL